MCEHTRNRDHTKNYIHTHIWRIHLWNSIGKKRRSTGQLAPRLGQTLITRPRPKVVLGAKLNKIITEFVCSNIRKDECSLVSPEGRAVISRDGDDNWAAKVYGGPRLECGLGPPPNRWGSVGGVCRPRVDRGTAKAVGEGKTGKTGEAR